MKNTVTIINQQAAIDYFQSRCKPLAAQLIEDCSYSIGFKGERFPEYVLMDTIHRLIAQPLVREMECEVVQHMIDVDQLYFVGVLPHDVVC